MDQVQQWFERLVGVTPENRTRRYVTEPLFRQPLFDDLTRPADAARTVLDRLRKDARPLPAVKRLLGNVEQGSYFGVAEDRALGHGLFSVQVIEAITCATESTAL